MLQRDVEQLFGVLYDVNISMCKPDCWKLMSLSGRLLFTSFTHCLVGWGSFINKLQYKEGKVKQHI